MGPRADRAEDVGQAAKAGFAERHGPTVLLGVGVVLVLAGLAGVFAAHQVAASAMFTTGVVAIIAAAVLGRMEGRFRIFFLSGSLSRSSRRPDA